MQKRPNKRELRTELEKEMADYLSQGGEVVEIPRGATGLVDGRYSHALSFDPQRNQRTPVPDVVQAIEQRRHSKRKPKIEKPKPKIIYDDFGEPVRVILE